MRSFISKYYLELITIFLFILILPLSLKINFLQNDDWNRTYTTYEFIKGNFSLKQETANTFYLQGIIGTIFYYLTSSTKFSILTLLFSVLGFYFFSKTLYKYHNQTKISSILLGLLFFLNPFFVYSVFGYMAENYYMFFQILSFYFFSKFIYLQNELNKDNDKVKDKVKDKDAYKDKNINKNYEKEIHVSFIISNLFIILGFFVKQVSLVIFLAYLFYLLFSKSYRYAIKQFLFFVGTLSYYYFLFPRTEEMNTKDVVFSNLFNINYSISLIWIDILYIVAFTFPLILLLFSQLFEKISIKDLSKDKLFYVILNTILLVLLYFGIKRNVDLGILWSREFPYLQNTFTRYGYYTQNLSGTSYQYRGIYDLFKYWELILYPLGVFLIFYLLSNIKKLLNPWSIFVGGYLALTVTILEMFDRYLLPIYPAFILMFVYLYKGSERIKIILLSIFVFFMILLNYQYSIDFVLSNNYMWSKAEKLDKEEQIDKSLISVNRAWKKVYVSDLPRLYYFSYDSPKVNDNFKYNFELVEKHTIKHPFDIHINPDIYLYKRILYTPSIYVSDVY